MTHCQLTPDDDPMPPIWLILLFLMVVIIVVPVRILFGWMVPSGHTTF